MGGKRRDLLGLLPQPTALACYKSGMNEKVKALGQQARRLTPDERVALVEDVLMSLDPTEPELDQLWAREALDRLRAYERGEMEAFDLKDVFGKYHLP